MVTNWVVLGNYKLDELWNVGSLCLNLDGLVLEIQNGSTDNFTNDVNWHFNVYLLTLANLNQVNVLNDLGNWIFCCTLYKNQLFFARNV